jgi:hypothetical protein
MEQITTIKTENGELYVQGDKIVGRMEIKGNITRWYKGDKLHRDGDLPASIERNNDGVVIREDYYRDGKHHRDGDLPAHIERIDAQYLAERFAERNVEQSINGVVRYEMYYRNGTRIALEQILLEEKEQESAAVIEKLTQEVAAEHAKNAELQSQLDQLRQKIKAIVE